MGSLSTFDVSDVKVLGFTVTDLRFPTSLDGVGSDAMHVGTNGSHPYIRLETKSPRSSWRGYRKLSSNVFRSLNTNKVSRRRLSAMDVAASSFAWLLRFSRNG